MEVEINSLNDIDTIVLVAFHALQVEVGLASLVYMIKWLYVSESR